MDTTNRFGNVPPDLDDGGEGQVGDYRDEDQDDRNPPGWTLYKSQ